MTTTPTPQAIRMPLAKLAIAEFGAVGVIAGLAALAVAPFDAEILRAIVPATVATVFGVLFGLTALALLTPRPAGHWGMPVLFAGMARMFAALAVAAWAWLTLEPHRLGFWGTFLAAGLAALIAEVCVAIRVIGAGGSATIDTNSRGDSNSHGEARVAEAL
ncbi:MAG: hypothetical protein CMJ31_09395 [Phycisphaerae bacterium]|nr:hypothetical protein [Phycisphaerae bacterium]